MSSALTINFIPSGLGSKKNPGIEYPISDSLAPQYPQAFNRYSYVYNNPLRYNDPNGWWTFGVGLNVFAGLGIGVGVTGPMFVFDGQGNYGWAHTTSVGMDVGASLSGGLQVQITFGDTTINDLNGWSETVGGSLPAFPVGVDVLQGRESKDYVGINFNIGPNAFPIPEVHDLGSYTMVQKTGSFADGE